MAAATKIEWEAEPDFRGDLRSTDGRFIISQWADDDRWRYEVLDTLTKRRWEYANSYSEARSYSRWSSCTRVWEEWFEG